MEPASRVRWTVSGRWRPFLFPAFAGLAVQTIVTVAKGSSEGVDGASGWLVLAASGWLWRVGLGTFLFMSLFTALPWSLFALAGQHRQFVRGLEDGGLAVRSAHEVRGLVLPVRVTLETALGPASMGNFGRIRFDWQAPGSPDAVAIGGMLTDPRKAGRSEARRLMQARGRPPEPTGPRLSQGGKSGR